MLIDAVKNKDIRNRLLFTLFVLILFGIGSNIPVPGINHDVLKQVFNGENSGIFDLFNLFTGGSFQNFTLFALGVTPYITGSIIIQLLTIAFPYFENLSKEGETGRKKMANITRYLAIVLAMVQAIGLTLGLFRNAIVDKTALTVIMIVLLLTAGTSFLMWIGEQVNEYGIGNGMSLLIFAGIVTRLPIMVGEVITQTKDGSLSIVADVLIILATVAIIAAVIFVQNGVRKIPTQYAGNRSKGKILGKTTNHLPIKVNAAGVIPIIFSMTILQMPMMLAYFKPQSKAAEWVSKYLSVSGNPGVWIYMGINVFLIIAFTYFYTAIVFKPDEISDNLRQAGGSIPGIRPGEATTNYLKKISNRLALVSALFLAAVSVLPTIVGLFTPLNLAFGGTSILILVGVANDTVTQIETRLLQTSYSGFLK